MAPNPKPRALQSPGEAQSKAWWKMGHDWVCDLGLGSPKGSPRTAFLAPKTGDSTWEVAYSRHLINAYGKKAWRDLVFPIPGQVQVKAARGFCRGGPHTRGGGSDDAHEPWDSSGGLEPWPSRKCLWSPPGSCPGRSLWKSLEAAFPWHAPNPDTMEIP